MAGSSNEYHLGIRIPMAILLILILVVGFIGNGLVCWTIYRNSELRKTFNNWFILNMAIADIGVLTFVIYFPLKTYIQGELTYLSIEGRVNGLPRQGGTSDSPAGR